MRDKKAVIIQPGRSIMATVKITSPQTNAHLPGMTIPVHGTISLAGRPVTVSLYLDGSPVPSQQDKAATVTNNGFTYTFNGHVAPGHPYLVLAKDDLGDIAYVDGLMVMP
jgi:hypothetical protein